MAIAIRRRFRFNLRTIMATLTIIALCFGWLAWDIRLVQQRRALLQYLESSGQMHGALHPPFPDAARMAAMAADVTQIAEETFGPEPYTRYPPLAPGPLSAMRIWLEDQPCLYLAYWQGPDTERIRELFPEAIVVVSDRPYKEAAAMHGWRIPVRRPSP